MKSKDVKVVSGTDTGDVVLVMKKTKFPWWILLLLIPLILLIPVGRNINALITDESGSVPLSNQPAQVVYPDVSTFGSVKPVDVDLTTDTEGKLSVRNLSVPLWYRLFAGRKDTVYISSNGDCNTLAGGADCYRSFPNDEYRKFSAKNVTAGASLLVVDADAASPLEGASVKVSILPDGQVFDKISDGQGSYTLADLPICKTIRLVGSKQGYINDTIEATVKQLIAMQASDKTLKLRKMRGDIEVIVKNLADRKPIPGATVKITSMNKKSTTNNSGVAVFNNLDLDGQLSFLASKQGFHDTTLAGYTVAQFVQLPAEQRTMYLRPVERKPDPPKQDPPKQDPPKQDPPANHREMKGKSGALRVNLQWNCTTDLDLQVINPCGDTIQAHHNGQMCHGVKSGVLDVDANSTYTNDPYCCTTTTPQENMYWTTAVKGRYKIIVDCYFWRERHNKPIEFTITIEDRGKLTYKTGTISKNQRHLVVCTYDIDYD